MEWNIFNSADSHNRTELVPTLSEPVIYINSHVINSDYRIIILTRSSGFQGTPRYQTVTPSPLSVKAFIICLILSLLVARAGSLVKVYA